jgi:resuscitation-promoting factor RpfB
VLLFNMKSLTHSTTTYIRVFITSVIVLMAAVISLIAVRASATDGTPVQDGRLITIHDRGTQSVILSHSATIADALNEAGVQIDKNDAVEPALSEKLVATEYEINIYRARPVIVVDGATKLKVNTPYQTADQIAKSVGISLYDEDNTTITRTDNIVAEGAGLILTIDRAMPVSLTLYGATSVIRTQAVTVGAMLKEKGIALGQSDRVLPAESTVITADQSIRVWREGKQTITVAEPVAFSTNKIQDGDQYVGYSLVKTAGAAGERNATYEVIIQDGKEVSRTEIASITTKEPSAQIEIVGAKIRAIPYAGGGSKTEWLTAAGIPQADWGYAESIVQRESGWNPNAVNASSGACGLAQALPCSKVPGNPLNPVDSLRWQYGYVNARYGGYAGAYAFWQINHWY